MRYPTQEEAQENLNAFRALWRKAIAKAQQHPPEYWAAKRKALGEEYRASLVAAKDAECGPQVEWRQRLRDAGVESQHLEGLRKMDERHAFVATRRWWGQAKVAEGEQEEWDDTAQQMRRVPRMARRWPFLVLLGASGAGKTQAAVWALREAVRAYPWNAGAGGSNAQRRPFVLLTGPDFARLPLYGNHDYARMDYADDLLGEARRCVTLVIDDFPRAQLSRPHMEAMTALLMARHGERRATILTANMDQQTLEERLDGAGSVGGPLWRRLSEKGVVVTLKQRGAPSLLVGGMAREWGERDEKR